MNSLNFEFWELLLLPLYLSIIFGTAYFIAPKADRKLFMWALAARIAGALVFASIYLFYYGGGDTIAYYLTAKPFVSLMLDQPAASLIALFSEYSIENYSLFTAETGYPLRYIYLDPQTFTVSRILFPVLLITFNRYLLATVVLSALTFIGPWKLFTLFRTLFHDKWVAAISALFVPSVLFWGAGISKDTVTFTSAAYLVYGFYHIAIKRDFKIVRLLGTVASLYLILAIKPYIFIALLPGLLLWWLSAPVTTLKNRILRRMAIPVISVVSSLIFIFMFQQFNDILGDYAADQILEKALVTQEDLKRDFYGGNSFDIGEVNPTFLGVVSKFPIATFYGLYGPTIFQVKSIVMLFSALENTVLILLTLRIFLTFRFRKLLNNTLDYPFLLFSLVFVLLFAFSIGFTTPNFGAMVRFKIPLLPFFVLFLLISYRYLNPNHKTQGP